MKRSSFAKNPKGFSLVEILVVIAIIAALAGASYPVITNALTKAKVTEAEKVAADLIVAVNAFEDKYGFLPYPSSETPGADLEVYKTDNGKLLKVLMGKDDTLNENNLPFFEFQPAESKRNGIDFGGGGDTPKGLYDPWGNPYIIVIDHSGDREIDLSTVPELSSYKTKDGEAVFVYKNVAIATGGPDKVINDIKDVKSW